MNALLRLLTAPEWSVVVKALLHTLWQAALLAVLLALALRRSTRPTTRYYVSLTSLAAVVVAGVLSWALLSRSLPAGGHGSNLARANAAFISQPTEVSRAGESTAVATTIAPLPPEPSRWTAWLALAWMAGAGLMLARAAIQVAGAERLRRSGRPLEDPRVAELLVEARRALRLARQVRITVTDRLTSPAVIGVLVPTLILPLSLLTTLTPEQIRFILLHELAHIRRGDYLANLLQLFAEALLFFNPAVWWISHQVRREREACCDALAIELCRAPADYAQTLVRVAENVLNPPPAAAPAFGGRNKGPSPLNDRVQRLLVPGYRPALRLTWRAMLMALVLGSALLVFSAVGTRLTVAAIDQKMEIKSLAPPLPEDKRPDPDDKMLEIAQLESGPPSATNAAATALTNQTPVAASPAITASFVAESLEARRFLFNLPEFVKQAGLTNADTQPEAFKEALLKFFSDAGVDMQPPRSLFLSGMGNQKRLLVNATPSELDRIQCAVQRLSGSDSPVTDFTAYFRALSTNTNLPPAQPLDSLPIPRVRVGQPPLQSRLFTINPNTFFPNLARAGFPPAWTNTWASDTIPIKSFFAKRGVDLSSPRMILYNSRAATLGVIATAEELDLISTAIDELNTEKPQIDIKTWFTEVPEKVVEKIRAKWPSAQTTTNGVRVIILTPVQTQEVMKEIRQVPKNPLGICNLTVADRQQAQMNIVNLKSIVMGINPAALTPPGIEGTNSLMKTMPVPIGKTLDFTPIVAADGHTIQLTLSPSVMEFLGYDKPASKVTAYVNGAKTKIPEPLPRFRARRTIVNASVQDGSTLLLEGFVPQETFKGKGSEMEVKEVAPDPKRRLLVFVTSSLIDSMGNRIHPEAR
jgi:beta-lactamase regulating signal transducer with metallopeptidase domain